MRRHQPALPLTLSLVLTAALTLSACQKSASGDTSSEEVQSGVTAFQDSEASGDSETTAVSAADEIPAPDAAGGSNTGSMETAGADTDTDAPSASCPSIPADSYPKVDGSTATLPLSYALYQAATGEDEEAAMAAITHNKTDTSYYYLADGMCDLVLAYEPSEETREYIEESDNILMRPIGRDALVFMRNASNPVTSLTEEQLRAVYSGEITSWRDLGGADEEIAAFQRTPNSGSQTLMEKLVMKGIPMADAPSHYQIGSMGDLLDKVSSYNNQGNAIGYSVYFYARNMHSVPGLEFLSVDEVTPSKDTIRNGSYPYVNEFYAAIREDEAADSPARLLFDWLTTEEGQDLVADTGYVPVLDRNGTEEAAVAAMTLTVQGDSAYDLEEDQVILLDGDTWFSSPAVHIMNADMTEQDVIEGCSMTEKIRVQSLDDPLILMDAVSGKKGLYNIGLKTWIVEPEYTILNRNSCGDYLCCDPEKNDQIYNGTELVEMGDDYLCAGDYYWIKDDTGYSIRKGWEETTGHVDIADPELCSVQYDAYNHINPFVKLDPGTGREYVYTLDGDLLFSPEDLQSAFEDWQDLSYYVYGCTNTEGLLRVGIEADEDTTEYWIFDIETKELEWVGDGDMDIILCNKEGDHAFRTSGEFGTLVLTDSLEPLRASDGTPYEYCFGLDCYGYQDPESGRVVIESLDASIHFEMPAREKEFDPCKATMIASGVLLYEDWDSSLFELIRDGDLLCSSDRFSTMFISEMPGDLLFVNQEYAAVNMVDTIFVIRADTGEVTYQTAEDSLAAKAWPVAVFRSGSWLNFRDPDGNLIMRLLADQSGAD